VKHFFSRERAAVQDQLPADSSVGGRLLLAGGVFLVMLGSCTEAITAAVDLYRHEALDYSILSQVSLGAAERNALLLTAGWPRTANCKAKRPSISPRTLTL